MLPGSATILSKKTGATEVTLGQLETFTSYYVKVAISISTSCNFSYK